MTADGDEQDDRRVVWQDVEARLPSNWELVRFGRHYGRGACTFADPYGERLQVSWQRDTSAPDFARLLSDIRSGAQVDAAGDAAGPELPIEELTSGEGWQGLVIHRAGHITTRAVRYDASNRALMEVAVQWGDERDAGAEARVLHGLCFLSPADRRPWIAFGISAELPATLPLSECRCLPADVTLGFRGKRKLPAVSIRRMGFVALWLKEPLRDWLGKTVPGPYRVLGDQARTTDAGHALVTLETRRRGRLTRPLLGPKASRFDYAVVCPEEQRLYHVVEERTANQPPLVRLSCTCGRLL